MQFKKLWLLSIALILIITLGGSFHYFTTYQIPKSTVKKALEQSINDKHANISLSLRKRQSQKT
ncbi:MAG: hypothetical protein ACQEXQ_19465 [Bacillota bacterium]